MVGAVGALIFAVLAIVTDPFLRYKDPAKQNAPRTQSRVFTAIYAVFRLASMVVAFAAFRQAPARKFINIIKSHSGKFQVYAVSNTESTTGEGISGLSRAFLSRLDLPSGYRRCRTPRTNETWN
jgi:hypothetical protein